jgi:hypothetical protein
MDTPTPPASIETQEIDLRRAASLYLQALDQIDKVHAHAPSLRDTKNPDALSHYQSAIKTARASSISALRNLIKSEQSNPDAPADVRFAVRDFLLASSLLSGISGDTASERLERSRRYLEDMLATPTHSAAAPIDAPSYSRALAEERLASFENIPDDDTDDIDGFSRASRL